MDHRAAVSTSAAERYLLGEMNEEERDQYEEHFFGCPECAEAVKATAGFRDAAEQVLREQAGRPAPAEEHSEQDDEGSRLRWIDWRALFWPIPAGAAASILAVLGLTAYQGLVVLPRLQGELREADTIQPAPSYFLSVSRSEVPLVQVTAGQQLVVLTLSRSSERSFPYYLCEVRAAEGGTVSRAAVPGPPPGEELQILLPVQGIPAGSYALAVAGLESASSSEPALEPVLYHFTLEREADGETAF